MDLEGWFPCSTKRADWQEPLMAYGAKEDWPESQLIVAPRAWQSDNLWREAQDRIGVALRAMYADLLQQPLSPRLLKLVRQIETRLETSRHAG